MLPTTHKIRVGMKIGGMSPSADIDTGGADYFFTRIKNVQNAYSSPGFVWDADILRRLDAITYEGDKFGECRPGFVENNRQPGNISSWKRVSQRPRNETNFKNGLSIFDRLRHIVCFSSSERNSIIEVFKKHKYQTFPDGRRLEAVIVTAGDVKPLP